MIFLFLDMYLILKIHIMFSIAESLTGGMIASSIVDIPGSSKTFKGGIVAYSLESKINILQIDEKLVNSSNGVSKEVAENMAVNVSKLFDTQYGIATTGYAEAYDCNKAQAYVAISKDGSIIYLYHFIITNKELIAYNLLKSKIVYTSNITPDRNTFRKFIKDTVIDEIRDLSLI